MTDTDRSIANALHGPGDGGQSYFVLHDGHVTRYDKGDPAPFTAPLNQVIWDAPPAVTTPASAHRYGKTFLESDGEGGGPVEPFVL
jgi:hypothetical protein